MPEDGVQWLPKDVVLTFEEIAQTVKAAVEVHDIRRFKITGGEPTMRRGLVDLIARLRRIEGVDELSLTTNGHLLEHLAHPLKEAGLDRVTVSIDSLRADRFANITRTGELATVLRGIDRAMDAGLASTKINCVTMRGTNDDELADFARLTIDRPLTVRFIEYMPLGDSAVLHESESGPAGGCGAQQRGNALISEAEARARIEAECGTLIPVDRNSEAGVGPATVYRLSGGAKGRIGFISAMSAPFCATCNRLRLTANGLLRSCLFDGGEVDLRSILRSGTASPFSIAQAMSDCVRLKPETHSGYGNQQMSRVGG